MVDAKRFEIEDMPIGRDSIPGAPVIQLASPNFATTVPGNPQSCEQYMNQFKMQRITVSKFEGVAENKWGMRMDPKTAVIIMVSGSGSGSGVKYIIRIRKRISISSSSRRRHCHSTDNNYFTFTFTITNHIH